MTKFVSTTLVAAIIIIWCLLAFIHRKDAHKRAQKRKGKLQDEL